MAVDKKISQLASGAPAQAGDEYVVARSGANFKLTLTNIAASMPPIGATTPNTGSFTSLTNSGNLTFSSTGQRITGDFSSSNPVLFQSSTTDGSTSIGVIPNGAGTATFVNLFGSSSANNCNRASMQLYNGQEMSLRSVGNGTFSHIPMTFYTGGSERMRLDTSGNLGIGTTPSAVLTPRLQVSSAFSAATASTPYNGVFVESSDAQAADKGGVISLGGLYDASSGPTRFAAIAGLKENGTSGNFAGYLAFYSRANGSSPAERMRIDSSGNVGIGGTAGAASKLQVTGTLPTSSGVSRSCISTATIPSGTTTAAIGFETSLTTQATSFTNATTYHFAASNLTIGAGSTVTNQIGFYAGSALTAATNNYGFFSDIASGSNRWNFYAAGTADNYFAGNVGIGTASPGTKLTVSSATNAGISVTDGTVTTIMYNTGSANGTVGTTSNHPMAFYANNAERMRITTNGEVYIAGTTDQGAYNLQCNGTGVWGAGAYVNGSDARLKNNIQSLDSGLDVVKAMRPVTFQYKPEYSNDQSVQPGFIAQELQKAMAGKPYLEGVVQEGTNHLNVAYQNIIPILAKAIQELEAKVAALEAK